MNDSDNYRGITVQSFFRINSVSETSDILGTEQSGFRKGHSMTDHVFLLYIVSLMYNCSEKNSYFARLLTIKRPLTVCSTDCCGENC